MITGHDQIRPDQETGSISLRRIVRADLHATNTPFEFAQARSPDLDIRERHLLADDLFEADRGGGRAQVLERGPKPRVTRVIPSGPLNKLVNQTIFCCILYHPENSGSERL